MWRATGNFEAAVGEGLGGSVAEVGRLEVGGQVVEEGDVVYLESGVSIIGIFWEGETNLCDLSETDYADSEDLSRLIGACCGGLGIAHVEVVQAGLDGRIHQMFVLWMQSSL